MTSPRRRATPGSRALARTTRDRPAVVPLELAPAQARGRRRALEQVEQVGAQARQDGLGLGVAEADVELEHARAVGGEHEPGVEDPVERGAAAAQLVDDRLVDGARDLLDQGGVDPGDGRVGAHAAGVRALVAVEDPLVVLRRGHDDGRLAVAERQQRQLLADEVLLDHDAAGAEALLDEEVVQGEVGAAGSSSAMTTPLPAARPSNFRTTG